MFEMETNLFKTKPQNPMESLKKSLTRTEENEFKLIDKTLKSNARMEEKNGIIRYKPKDYSPEKVLKQLKSLPPFL